MTNPTCGGEPASGLESAPLPRPSETNSGWLCANDAPGTAIAIETATISKRTRVIRNLIRVSCLAEDLDEFVVVANAPMRRHVRRHVELQFQDVLIQGPVGGIRRRSGRALRRR